jgi:phage terminase small subunit
MRGRKPDLAANVVPMRPDGAGDPALVQAAVDRQVKALMPRGLSKELRAEWRRVGRILADPTVDRLKPKFCDVILRYCQECIELRKILEAMPEAGRRFYKTTTQDGEQEKAGRNGVQWRSHPNVAQYDRAFARWIALVTRLGLSPQDDRNLIPGQGDLFDPSDKYFS